MSEPMLVTRELLDALSATSEQWKSRAAQAEAELTSLRSALQRMTEERDLIKRVWSETAEPFLAWAQEYLDSGRWGGHPMHDAIKAELLERDASLTELRGQLRALVEQWRKVSRGYSVWDDAADELSTLLASGDQEHREKR